MTACPQSRCPSFDVGAWPPLVDDREIGVEPLGDRACPDHAADVGRHDQKILVVLLPEIAEQDGRCVDVVDGDVEEALNLIGVEIHDHHAVDAYCRQHVGDHLRGDGHPGRPGAPVLARIAVKRDDRRDAGGARPPQRVHDNEQLHQMMVRGWAGGLDHVNVFAPHVLLNLHERFAVREGRHRALAQVNANGLGYGSCQRQVGCSAENLHANFK